MHRWERLLSHCECNEMFYLLQEQSSFIALFVSSYRVSSSAFDSMRLWIVVVLCVLRLAVTRYHLQAYLNLAPKWVDQMKREAGRIAAIDIQKKVKCFFFK